MNQRLEELMTDVDPNLTETALQRAEVNNGDVQNNNAKSNVMQVLIFLQAT